MPFFSKKNKRKLSNDDSEESFKGETAHDPAETEQTLPSPDASTPDSGVYTGTPMAMPPNDPEPQRSRQGSLQGSRQGSLQGSRQGSLQGSRQGSLSGNAQSPVHEAYPLPSRMVREQSSQTSLYESRLHSPSTSDPMMAKPQQAGSNMAEDGTQTSRNSLDYVPPPIQQRKPSRPVSDKVSEATQVNVRKHPPKEAADPGTPVDSRRGSLSSKTSLPAELTAINPLQHRRPSVSRRTSSSVDPGETCITKVIYTSVDTQTEDAPPPPAQPAQALTPSNYPPLQSLPVLTGGPILIMATPPAPGPFTDQPPVQVYQPLNPLPQRYPSSPPGVNGGCCLHRVQDAPCCQEPEDWQQGGTRFVRKREASVWLSDERDGSPPSVHDQQRAAEHLDCLMATNPGSLALSPQPEQEMGRRYSAPARFPPSRSADRSLGTRKQSGLSPVSKRSPPPRPVFRTSPPSRRTPQRSPPLYPDVCSRGPAAAGYYDEPCQYGWDEGDMEMEERNVVVDGHSGREAVRTEEENCPSPGGTRVVRRRQASIWLRDREDGSPRCLDHLDQQLDRLLSAGIQRSSTPQGDRAIESKAGKQRKQRSRTVSKATKTRSYIDTKTSKSYTEVTHQHISTQTRPGDDGRSTAVAGSYCSSDEELEEEMRQALKKILSLKKQHKDSRFWKPKKLGQNQKTALTEGCGVKTPTQSETRGSGPAVSSVTRECGSAAFTLGLVNGSFCPLATSTPKRQEEGGQEERFTGEHNVPERDHAQSPELLSGISFLQQSMAELLQCKASLQDNMDQLMQSKSFLKENLNQLRGGLCYERFTSGDNDRQQFCERLGSTGQDATGQVTQEQHGLQRNRSTSPVDGAVYSGPRGKSHGSQTGRESNTNRVAGYKVGGQGSPSLPASPKENRTLLERDVGSSDVLFFQESRNYSSKRVDCGSDDFTGRTAESRQLTPAASAPILQICYDLDDDDDHDADNDGMLSAERPYSPSPIEDTSFERLADEASALQERIQEQIFLEHERLCQDVEQQRQAEAVVSQGFEQCSLCQLPHGICVCGQGSENNNSDCQPDSTQMDHSSRQPVASGTLSIQSGTVREHRPEKRETAGGRPFRNPCSHPHLHFYRNSSNSYDRSQDYRADLGGQYAPNIQWRSSLGQEFYDREKETPEERPVQVQHMQCAERSEAGCYFGPEKCPSVRFQKRKGKMKTCPEYTRQPPTSKDDRVVSGNPKFVSEETICTETNSLNGDDGASHSCRHVRRQEVNDSVISQQYYDEEVVKSPQSQDVRSTKRTKTVTSELQSSSSDSKEYPVFPGNDYHSPGRNSPARQRRRAKLGESVSSEFLPPLTRSPNRSGYGSCYRGLSPGRTKARETRSSTPSPVSQRPVDRGPWGSHASTRDTISPNRLPDQISLTTRQSPTSYDTDITFDSGGVQGSISSYSRVTARQVGPRWKYEKQEIHVKNCPVMERDKSDSDQSNQVVERKNYCQEYEADILMTEARPVPNPRQQNERNGWGQSDVSQKKASQSPNQSNLRNPRNLQENRIFATEGSWDDYTHTGKRRPPPLSHEEMNEGRYRSLLKNTDTAPAEFSPAPVSQKKKSKQERPPIKYPKKQDSYCTKDSPAFPGRPLQAKDLQQSTASESTVHFSRWDCPHSKRSYQYKSYKRHSSASPRDVGERSLGSHEKRRSKSTSSKRDRQKGDATKYQISRSQRSLSLTRSSGPATEDSYFADEDSWRGSEAQLTAVCQTSQPRNSKGEYSLHPFDQRGEVSQYKDRDAAFTSAVYEQETHFLGTSNQKDPFTPRDDIPRNADHQLEITIGFKGHNVFLSGSPSLEPSSKSSPMPVTADKDPPCSSTVAVKVGSNSLKEQGSGKIPDTETTCRETANSPVTLQWFSQENSTTQSLMTENMEMMQQNIQHKMRNSQMPQEEYTQFEEHQEENVFIGVMIRRNDPGAKSQYLHQQGDRSDTLQGKDSKAREQNHGRQIPECQDRNVRPLEQNLENIITQNIHAVTGSNLPITEITIDGEIFVREEILEPAEETQKLIETDFGIVASECGRNKDETVQTITTDEQFEPPTKTRKEKPVPLKEDRGIQTVKQAPLVVSMSSSTFLDEENFSTAYSFEVSQDVDTHQAKEAESKGTNTCDLKDKNRKLSKVKKKTTSKQNVSTSTSGADSLSLTSQADKINDSKLNMTSSEAVVVTHMSVGSLEDEGKHKRNASTQLSSPSNKRKAKTTTFEGDVITHITSESSLEDEGTHTKNTSTQLSSPSNPRKAKTSTKADVITRITSESSLEGKHKRNNSTQMFSPSNPRKVKTTSFQADVITHIISDTSLEDEGKHRRNASIQLSSPSNEWKAKRTSYKADVITHMSDGSLEDESKHRRNASTQLSSPSEPRKAKTTSTKAGVITHMMSDGSLEDESKSKKNASTQLSFPSNPCKEKTASNKASVITNITSESSLEDEGKHERNTSMQLASPSNPHKSKTSFQANVITRIIPESSLEDEEKHKRNNSTKLSSSSPTSNPRKSKAASTKAGVITRISDGSLEDEGKHKKNASTQLSFPSSPCKAKTSNKASVITGFTSESSLEDEGKYRRNTSTQLSSPSNPRKRKTTFETDVIFHSTSESSLEDEGKHKRNNSTQLSSSSNSCKAKTISFDMNTSTHKKKKTSKQNASTSTSDAYFLPHTLHADKVNESGHFKTNTAYFETNVVTHITSESSLEEDGKHKRNVSTQLSFPSNPHQAETTFETDVITHITSESSVEEDGKHKRNVSTQLSSPSNPCKEKSSFEADAITKKKKTSNQNVSTYTSGNDFQPRTSHADKVDVSRYFKVNTARFGTDVITHIVSASSLESSGKHNRHPKRETQKERASDLLPTMSDYKTPPHSLSYSSSQEDKQERILRDQQSTLSINTTVSTPVPHSSCPLPSELNKQNNGRGERTPSPVSNLSSVQGRNRRATHPQVYTLSPQERKDDSKTTRSEVSSSNCPSLEQKNELSVSPHMPKEENCKRRHTITVLPCCSSSTKEEDVLSDGSCIQSVQYSFQETKRITSNFKQGEFSEQETNSPNIPKGRYTIDCLSSPKDFKRQDVCYWTERSPSFINPNRELNDAASTMREETFVPYDDSVFQEKEQKHERASIFTPSPDIRPYISPQIVETEARAGTNTSIMPIQLNEGRAIPSAPPAPEIVEVFEESPRSASYSTTARTEMQQQYPAECLKQTAVPADTLSQQDTGKMKQFEVSPSAATSTNKSVENCAPAKPKASMSEAMKNIVHHSPVTKQVFSPTTTLTVANHVYLSPQHTEGVVSDSYVKKGNGSGTTGEFILQNQPEIHCLHNRKNKSPISPKQVRYGAKKGKRSCSANSAKARSGISIISCLGDEKAQLDPSQSCSSNLARGHTGRLRHKREKICICRKCKCKNRDKHKRITTSVRPDNVSCNNQPAGHGSNYSFNFDKYMVRETECPNYPPVGHMHSDSQPSRQSTAPNGATQWQPIPLYHSVMRHCMYSSPTSSAGKYSQHVFHKDPGKRQRQGTTSSESASTCTSFTQRAHSEPFSVDEGSFTRSYSEQSCQMSTHRTCQHEDHCHCSHSHHCRKAERLRKKLREMKRRQHQLINQVKMDCTSLVDSEVKVKDAQLLEERMSKGKLKDAIVTLQKQLTDLEREAWQSALSKEAAQQSTALDKMKLETQLSCVQREASDLRDEKETLACKLETVEGMKAELEQQLTEARLTSREMDLIRSHQAEELSNYKNLVDICHVQYQEQRDTATNLQQKLTEVTKKLEERDKESETLKQQLERAKSVLTKRHRQVQRLKMMQIQLRVQCQQEQSVSAVAIKEKQSVEAKLHTENTRYSSLLAQVDKQNERLMSVRTKIESLDPTHLKQQYEVRYQGHLDAVLRHINDVLEQRAAVAAETEMRQQEMMFRERAHEANLQILQQRNQQLKMMKDLFVETSPPQNGGRKGSPKPKPQDSYINSSACDHKEPSCSPDSEHSHHDTSRKCRHINEHCHFLPHSPHRANTAQNNTQPDPEPASNDVFNDKRFLDNRLRALKAQAGNSCGLYTSNLSKKGAAPHRRISAVKAESRSYLASIKLHHPISGFDTDPVSSASSVSSFYFSQSVDVETSPLPYTVMVASYSSIQRDSTEQKEHSRAGTDGLCGEAQCNHGTLENNISVSSSEERDFIHIDPNLAALPTRENDVETQTPENINHKTEHDEHLPFLATQRAWVQDNETLQSERHVHYIPTTSFQDVHRQTKFSENAAVQTRHGEDIHNQTEPMWRCHHVAHSDRLLVYEQPTISFQREGKLRESDKKTGERIIYTKDHDGILSGVRIRRNALDCGSCKPSKRKSGKPSRRNVHGELESTPDGASSSYRTANLSGERSQQCLEKYSSLGTQSNYQTPGTCVVNAMSTSPRPQSSSSSNEPHMHSEETRREYNINESIQRPMRTLNKTRDSIPLNSARLVPRKYKKYIRVPTNHWYPHESLGSSSEEINAKGIDNGPGSIQVSKKARNLQSERSHDKASKENSEKGISNAQDNVTIYKARNKESKRPHTKDIPDPITRKPCAATHVVMRSVGFTFHADEETSHIHAQYARKPIHEANTCGTQTGCQPRFADFEHTVAAQTGEDVNSIRNGSQAASPLTARTLPCYGGQHTAGSAFTICRHVQVPSETGTERGTEQVLHRPQSPRANQTSQSFLTEKYTSTYSRPQSPRATQTSQSFLTEKYTSTYSRPQSPRATQTSQSFLTEKYTSTYSRPQSPRTTQTSQSFLVQKHGPAQHNRFSKVRNVSLQTDISTDTSISKSTHYICRAEDVPSFRQNPGGRTSFTISNQESNKWLHSSRAEQSPRMSHSGRFTAQEISSRGTVDYTCSLLGSAVDEPKDSSHKNIPTQTSQGRATPPSSQDTRALLTPRGLRLTSASVQTEQIVDMSIREKIIPEKMNQKRNISSNCGVVLTTTRENTTKKVSVGTVTTKEEVDTQKQTAYLQTKDTQAERNRLSPVKVVHLQTEGTQTGRDTNRVVSVQVEHTWSHSHTRLPENVTFPQRDVTLRENTIQQTKVMSTETETDPEWGPVSAENLVSAQTQTMSRKLPQEKKVTSKTGSTQTGTSRGSKGTCLQKDMQSYRNKPAHSSGQSSMQYSTNKSSSVVSIVSSSSCVVSQSHTMISRHPPMSFLPSSSLPRVLQMRGPQQKSWWEILNSIEQRVQQISAQANTNLRLMQRNEHQFSAVDGNVCVPAGEGHNFYTNPAQTFEQNKDGSPIAQTGTSSSRMTSTVNYSVPSTSLFEAWSAENRASSSSRAPSGATLPASHLPGQERPPPVGLMSIHVSPPSGTGLPCDLSPSRATTHTQQGLSALGAPRVSLEPPMSARHTLYGRRLTTSSVTCPFPTTVGQSMNSRCHTPAAPRMTTLSPPTTKQSIPLLSTTVQSTYSAPDSHTSQTFSQAQLFPDDQPTYSAQCTTAGSIPQQLSSVTYSRSETVQRQGAVLSTSQQSVLTAPRRSEPFPMPCTSPAVSITSDFQSPPIDVPSPDRLAGPCRRARFRASPHCCADHTCSQATFLSAPSQSLAFPMNTATSVTATLSPPSAPVCPCSASHLQAAVSPLQMRSPSVPMAPSWVGSSCAFPNTCPLCCLSSPPILSRAVCSQCPVSLLPASPPRCVPDLRSAPLWTAGGVHNPQLSPVCVSPCPASLSSTPVCQSPVPCAVDPCCMPHPPPPPYPRGSTVQTRNTVRFSPTPAQYSKSSPSTSVQNNKGKGKSTKGLNKTKPQSLSSSSVKNSDKARGTSKVDHGTSTNRNSPDHKSITEEEIPTEDGSRCSWLPNFLRAVSPPTFGRQGDGNEGREQSRKGGDDKYRDPFIM